MLLVSETQKLLNALQEIMGRDKSTPTVNSHTPSKLSSYCSPDTQEACMMCYCWMTSKGKEQSREREHVAVDFDSSTILYLLPSFLSEPNMCDIKLKKDG